ncbi:MAG: hydrogenase maturation protease [Chloroflexi bacterium]|nr:hydrogenase maturation protease [Chloroflexota bacterium]
MPDVLILGLGNTLRCDDGVGPRVVEALQRLDLPPEVEMLVAVAATSGLLHAIADRQKVIVVDAIQGGSEPGSVYRASPEDLEAGSQSLISAHHMGILEALKLAQALSCAPEEFVVIGVEPQATGWGLDLSPEVAAAVPAIVRLVAEEANRR